MPVFSAPATAYTNPYWNADLYGYPGALPGNPTYWQAEQQVAEEWARTLAAVQAGQALQNTAEPPAQPTAQANPGRRSEIWAAAPFPAPPPPAYTSPDYHRDQLKWLMHAL